jgi:mannose-6-phosphate isomerase-like protein (cupin superfamily)
MQSIKADQAVRYENSKACVAFEYEFPDERDIDGAVVEINGRYPEGLATNEVCKELIHVLEGSGTLTCDGRVIMLTQGDAALIQPNEKYFFEGTLKLFIASSPAWYKAQHKLIHS